MFRSAVREQLQEDENLKNIGYDFIFLVNHNITNWDQSKSDGILYTDVKNNIINAITKIDKI